MAEYCKRLIEVDLPIKRISAHARREKGMRRGHVPLLHIWPATRPPAACRAVLCAVLWPDPVDPLCQETFKKEAAKIMKAFRDKIGGSVRDWDNDLELRKALLDFIADFANWDNSTKKEYLTTSAALTKSAHSAFGGLSESKPLVVDTFAGGGAIPLEALRVGADTFAGELNPVATLLNKVILEYIPRFGIKLVEVLDGWETFIKKVAKEKLDELYPIDEFRGTTTAYLWARTVTCEGPNCGVQIPLQRSLWLAKKTNRSVALQYVIDSDKKTIDFAIIEKAKNKKWEAIEVPQGLNIKTFRVDYNPKLTGTIARGSATCPICGYTTPVESIRAQFSRRKGGSKDARLICVVTVRPGQTGRFYRLPRQKDVDAYYQAKRILERGAHKRFVPDELLPPEGALGFRVQKYGMAQWQDLFNERQLLTLSTLIEISDEFLSKKLNKKDVSLREALSATVALIMDKLIDNNAALCMWQLNTPNAAHVFGRWAMPMVWDYAEVNPISEAGGSISSLTRKVRQGIIQLSKANLRIGSIHNSDASEIPLPDDSASAFVTDPPYYDAIAYADIADYFYVWLKRMPFLSSLGLFEKMMSPKAEECIVDPVRTKDKNYFQRTMTKALTDARRILVPSGIGLIVFAHKSTEGWEAQLSAMIKAGWIITASWSIDTEMMFRMRGRDSAALASSVHLVCRPRENPDGSLQEEIGDWRDVLQELPKRIHEWMPRLAEEGVVGADAIFACLGPALEIYSRYSSVEKASGEKVELKEYLEKVWAAVSREALNMIFEGADASGFEEDARLTAMWLWTLRTTVNGGNGVDENGAQTKSLPGYSLEYDAARKIAQGLGAHLENLSHLVEIKGNTAMLLSAAARTNYLFGKDAAEAPKGKRKKKIRQQTLFDFEEDIKQIEEESGDWVGELSGKAGSTVLDQLHQSMILFAAGRGEAMKRFLVEEGVGRNPLFWRLAQALSALYPAATDEKRWVDGVLARKKGLGL